MTFFGQNGGASINMLMSSITIAKCQVNVLRKNFTSVDMFVRDVERDVSMFRGSICGLKQCSA